MKSNVRDVAIGGYCIEYGFIKSVRVLEASNTGTKIQGRKALDALLKQVKRGDTVVYDSVSRMSRNASEGCQLYEELFNRG